MQNRTYEKIVTVRLKEKERLDLNKTCNRLGVPAQQVLRNYVLQFIEENKEK